MWEDSEPQSKHLRSTIHDSGVVLTMLDLRAVFGTIDHDRLFHRLEHSVGAKGPALEWLKSYI